MKYRREKEKTLELPVSTECGTEMSLIGQGMNLPSISMSVITDEFSFKLEDKKPKDSIKPNVLFVNAGTDPYNFNIQRKF